MKQRAYVKMRTLQWVSSGCLFFSSQSMSWVAMLLIVGRLLKSLTCGDFSVDLPHETSKHTAVTIVVAAAAPRTLLCRQLTRITPNFHDVLIISSSAEGRK